MIVPKLILAGFVSAFFLSAVPASAEEIVLYSGRSKSLVAPLLKRLEKATGIKVLVKYGKTAPMARLIQQEGKNSPADIFWSQDAGALGALAKGGTFDALPKDVLEMVPPAFRGSKALWVATSGRARVLAYSPKRLKPEDLPTSVHDLTGTRWKGRVGWAPSNASFQAFVTAMRVRHGEEKTLAWLKAMKANGTKVYPKNTPIIEALAAGEIDLGLPNHYYLLRFKTRDKKFPVAQLPFADKDTGNLVNVAGVGLLKSSKKKEAALRCIRFLLGAQAQQYFTSAVFEYPMRDDVIPNPRLLSFEELRKKAPAIDLSALDDLEGTLKLLRAAGLL